MAISEQWLYAQQSVLGSVLIGPECAGKLVFGVGEEDFTATYRTMYKAVRDLYTTGKTVDPVTVLDQMGGGSEYRQLIAQLMDVTPTAANIDAYIEVCRSCSRVHRYQEMGAALQTVETAQQAEEILGSANKITVGKGMESWTLSEALHDFFRRYNKKPEYLPWFLHQINPRLTVEFGDFCLLGGRPSSGKSAFALEAAVYWAVVCGYRVGFYSHETSREKLTNRMLAACARVPLDAVKQGTLTDKQLQDVCDVAARINAAPIDLISCAGKTVAEMQAFALSRRHQIVIVDYLQIVAGPGKDEYSQVSAISKGLHVMCQSLGIFCLALCQLSRTRGSRPALEDLRSSGQLEQDADAVLFLHRKDGENTTREFIIAKNKEGECRATTLYFDGPIQHFSYLGPGEKPLQGHDYRSRPGYKQPSEDLEQLPMETAVPFEN
jgi:replicative DNA helicase